MLRLPYIHELDADKLPASSSVALEPAVLVALGAFLDVFKEACAAVALACTLVSHPVVFADAWLIHEFKAGSTAAALVELA